MARKIAGTLIVTFVSASVSCSAIPSLLHSVLSEGGDTLSTFAHMLYLPTLSEPVIMFLDSPSLAHSLTVDLLSAVLNRVC